MKHNILICALTVLLAIATEGRSRIVLVAGQPSHGPGEHEFVKMADLLADCLNASRLDIEALVSTGFPSTVEMDGVDSIFIFSDGMGRHVANGHLSELREHLAAGGGLGVIHWALEPGDPAMKDFLDEALGGHFKINHSVNPIWTLRKPLLTEHPISRGVELIDIEDEWYYHIFFTQTVDPVLQAVPPLDSLGKDGPRSSNPDVREALHKAVPQTLVWARTTESKARTFGFTGGHYLFNLSENGYRKLLLNAIVWTAGIEVPAGGVESEITPIPHYSTIDQAIARGDIRDVRRHLAAAPGSLQQGGNPRLTTLQQAILRKKEDIALMLIEMGADPDRADESKRTPLHLAVERDLPRVVKALLEKGADPDRLDRVGWSPLHHAAAEKRVAMLRDLLAGGADPMCLSARGGTPLHEAAASGNTAIVKMLLKAGTDPAHAADSGVTALDIAKEYGNREVAGILMECEDDNGTP